MAKNKNKEIIKDSLEEEKIIEEDETENAETAKANDSRNHKKNEFTIGNLDSAKEVISSIKNKDGNDKKHLDDGFEKLFFDEDLSQSAENSANGAGQEAGPVDSTETERDIIEEYQEIVLEAKRRAGGKFEDIEETLREDFGVKHKELQQIERKIQTLKTDQAKERAIERAEQILEDLRQRAEAIEDKTDKNIESGKNVGNKIAGQEQEAEEGERGAKEVEELKESEPYVSEQAKDFEESELKAQISRERKKSTSRYMEAVCGLKGFEIEQDLQKEINGFFDEKRERIILEEAKKFLSEGLDGPKELRSPELVGYDKSDLDKMSDSEVKNLVKSIGNFKARVEENPLWVNNVNISERMRTSAGSEDPKVKALIFAELYTEQESYQEEYNELEKELENQEDAAKRDRLEWLEAKIGAIKDTGIKVLGRIEGKDVKEMREFIAAGAGIGKQKEYIADLGNLQRIREEIEARKKYNVFLRGGLPGNPSFEEWEEIAGGTSEIRAKALDTAVEHFKKKLSDNYYPKELFSKNNARILKGLRGDNGLFDKNILALKHFDIDIKNIKVKGWWKKSKVVEMKSRETGEIKESIRLEEFADFVKGKADSHDGVLNQYAAQYLEKEWLGKFNQERDIVIDEAGKGIEKKGREWEFTGKWDLIEKAYGAVAQDTAAEYLAKSVNTDKTRAKEIEKRLGKGTGVENLSKRFSDIMEVGADIEEGTDYEENEETAEQALALLNIDPRKLTNKQKNKFTEFSDRKYGLLDWIFYVAFVPAENEKTKKKK